MSYKHTNGSNVVIYFTIKPTIGISWTKMRIKENLSFQVLFFSYYRFLFVIYSYFGTWKKKAFYAILMNYSFCNLCAYAVHIAFAFEQLIID